MCSLDCVLGSKFHEILQTELVPEEVRVGFESLAVIGHLFLANDRQGL